MPRAKSFADELSMQRGGTLADATEIIEAVGHSIKDLLRDGFPVRIPHVGTLTPEYKPERKGRNPRTQEPIDIPAKYVVGFSPAAELKECL